MFRLASTASRVAPLARGWKQSPAVATSLRHFNVHEYQGSEILAKHGINTARGGPATTPAEALKVAKELDTDDLVIKAQIHAGGRGKGTFDNGLKGGVFLCTSPDDVQEYAEKMLGHRLITKQTGPEGRPVNTVYIAERTFVRREMYFAIVMDRQSGGPVLVGSSEGGVEIEKTAEENPDAIVKEPVDIMKGLQPGQTERVAKALGFKGDHVEKAAEQFARMYDLFISCDCTQLEINPLIENNKGEIMCLDSKLNFDSNAEFRQGELFNLNDESQEDPREAHAKKFDLNYIGLDGNIGCLVNGAGLAMATMDIIKHYGGDPANFLDVGGGATERVVTEAFKLLNEDQQVKAILVNIFGGIMRCDVIAMGIIAAAKEINLRVPLVVRLQGTMADEGNRLMEGSGLKIIIANDLDDAAEKAVRLSSIVSMAEQVHVNVSFELPL